MVITEVICCISKVENEQPGITLMKTLFEMRCSNYKDDIMKLYCSSIVATDEIEKHKRQRHKT